jgi:hypothetical protein
MSIGLEVRDWKTRWDEQTGSLSSLLYSIRLAGWRANECTHYMSLHISCQPVPVQCTRRSKATNEGRQEP